VRDLTVGDPPLPALADISFDIHQGEILGVAGVEGNGQAELIEAIMGLRPSTGSIVLAGREISQLSTRARREAGIGYIPEDRQKDGLSLPFSLWENAMLGHQTRAPYAKGPWIDRAGAQRRTDEIIEQFDVRTPGHSVPVFTLSGGNQQKLVVGREMMADPMVLIAAHPTRGVDVGAQAIIWDILRDARAKGLAVLLISADLEELIGLSDRLLVMLRGRVVAELPPNEVTPTELGSYMTGVRSMQAGGDEDATADGER
jgi:simple sugar transport system ATP-binding protein